MRRGMGILVLALVLGGIGLMTATATNQTQAATAAPEPPGCAGLDAYRAAMFTTGKALGTTLAAQGIPATRDVVTYSSADWAIYAKDSATYQAALKAITPPAFAKAWHEAKIAHAGLLEQVGKAAAANGVMAVLAFKTELQANDAQTKAAANAAVKTCPAFAGFIVDYQALSGVNAQGTPVATPTT